MTGYNGYLKKHLPLIQKMNKQGKTATQIGIALYDVVGLRRKTRMEFYCGECIPWTPDRDECISTFVGLVRYVLGGQRCTPSRIKRLEHNVRRLQADLKAAKAKLAAAKAMRREQRV